MDYLTDVHAILLVFTILQFKHFLADFIFQTDRMIVEKGIYGARYGLYHSGIQALGTILAFAWIHPLLGIICAVLDFLSHYHIDWIKANINNKRNYSAKDRGFWIWLGLDQLLHQLTYLFLVGWVFFAI